MVTINAQVEIDASGDRIWEIVSDVDKDLDYWKGLSSIKNVRKEEDYVERIVKVGFMGSEGYQTIKLYPKKSIILTMTKGPLKGMRNMELSTIEDQKKTKLSVVWDFQFSGIPVFARAFVKSQLERTTKEALEKIALTAKANLISTS